MLELQRGKIARSGIGFRDVKAVIGHVDRRPVLPAVRLENIELTARNSRIVFSLRLETEVVPLAEKSGFALNEVVAMPANNLTIIFRRQSSDRLAKLA